MLSVDACTFSSNTTTGVGGGAILTSGSATVTNSTFIGNTAPINGGAINVQASGTLTMIDSTLFDNTSSGLGGAVSNLGTLTIINVTFAANHGSSGSAIATGNNANVTLYNSVFDNNVAASSPGALNPLGLPTTSNNVFFNNTANSTADDQNGYGTANFIVATSDPLGPLGDNGGPTQTMVPVPGGAAICAGDVALLPDGITTDQRGFPRIAPPNCLDTGSVQHEVIPVPVLSPPVLALLAGLLAMFGMYLLRFAAG